MRTKASHQDIVGKQFGQQAEAYLASSVHAEGGDLDDLVRMAAARRPSRALDLGCGGGHVTYRLAPQVEEVVACDLSQAMVDLVSAEAVRRGLGNVSGRRAAVERLPFVDGGFDMVATRYSAHHWSDFPVGLREARRVLGKDGMAVFIDVTSPGEPLLDTWFQTLELLRDPSHVRNRTEGEWRAELAAAGFRPGEATRYKLRLDFAAWVRRMKTPKAHVEAIRSLQARAAPEVSDYFRFEADGSFTIDTMLLPAGAA